MCLRKSTLASSLVVFNYGSSQWRGKFLSQGSFCCPDSQGRIWLFCTPVTGTVYFAFPRQLLTVHNWYLKLTKHNPLTTTKDLVCVITVFGKNPPSEQRLDYLSLRLRATTSQLRLCLLRTQCMLLVEKWRPLGRLAKQGFITHEKRPRGLTNCLHTNPPTHPYLP